MSDKYLYAGSYIVSYDLENPNIIKEYILVDRKYFNIDFNIYLKDNERIIVPRSNIEDFENGKQIVDMEYSLKPDDNFALIINSKFVNKKAPLNLSYSIMRLYYVWTKNNNLVYLSAEELNKEGKNVKVLYTVDYLGEVAGRHDVIKKTYPTGKYELLTAIDMDRYAIYSQYRSLAEDKSIWNYNYGNLREVHNEFRKRGIEFSKDLYKQIDEMNKRLILSMDQQIKNGNNKHQ